jgi:hypothetical protein
VSSSNAISTPAICFLFCETHLPRLALWGWKEITVSNQKDASMRGRFIRARQNQLALCLWAIFAAGLLVELAAPRLKIENNAFVMPPIDNAQAATLRPDALVRRERWMQGASGLLTLGGALALGVYYRRPLLVALKG